MLQGGESLFLITERMTERERERERGSVRQRGINRKTEREIV